MKGKKVILLILIYAVSSAYAQQQQQPLEVRGIKNSEISLLISHETGAINASGLGGCIEGASLMQIIDTNDSSLKQKILSLEEWFEVNGIKWELGEKQRHAFGRYATTDFNTPECTPNIKYFIKARVSVWNDPFGGTLESAGNGGDLWQFLQGSPKIESTDPEITKLAGHINGGYAQETVKEVFDLIRTRLKYDESYTKRQLSAKETLLEGKGACDEFSNLAAALLRAKGIPARIILGYAHDGRGWREHAWIEYYAQGYGWIAADPTYYEMNIDAMHITLAKLVDTEELKDKTILHSSDSKTETSKEMIMEVLGKGYFSEQDPFERQLYVSTSEKGAKALFTVENKSSSVMASRFHVEEPGNYRAIGNSERIELLQPSETRIIEWEFQRSGTGTGTTAAFCEEDDFGRTCYQAEEDTEERIYVEGITATKTEKGIKVNITLSNNAHRQEDFTIKINYSGNFIKNGFTMPSLVKKTFEFTIEKKDLENLVVEINARELNYYEKIGLDSKASLQNTSRESPKVKKAGLIETISSFILRIFGLNA